ncbi:hypothetical protein [Paraburkholderia sp. MM5482-R1]|uniref:hypothetical protein n=1 Tax=unclassified Paraburkholderia TaxID=2615204 RepID=UPI003D1ABB17
MTHIYSHHEDFETTNSSTSFDGFTLSATQTNGYNASGGDRGLWLGVPNKTTRYSAELSLNDAATFVSFRLKGIDQEGCYAVYLDAEGNELGRTQFNLDFGAPTDYFFDSPNGELIATVQLVFYSEFNGCILQDFAYGTETVPAGSDATQSNVGLESFFGTDGDDIFTMGDLSNFNADSTSIEGNGGIDTLKLTGTDQTLDLTNELHGKLSSIEVFDITGTGNNTLKLALGDVLDLGGKDLFIADGHTQLMVKGDAGDKVELSDLLPDGEDLGDWAQESGTTTVGGVEYDVFYHSGLNAELLVQHGVETTLNNH